MRDADTIIVGSGAGAQAAGLCLARSGQKVIMLEQHNVPGGWCHSFALGGHKFSPGVHFIGQLQPGGSSRALYEGLGIAKDLVFFRQNKDAYDRCMVAGREFGLPAGEENLLGKLQDHFPREKMGIMRYVREAMKVAAELNEIRRPNNFSDYLLFPWRTRHLARSGFFTLKQIIDFHLKDPYLKAFLSLQCGNHGLPPYRAPFVVHSLLMQHCIAGTCYPRGGGAAITKSYTKNIKKYGGEIRTSCKVKRILIEKDTNKPRAIGVELQNGEQLRAAYIISNADPHKTYMEMIGGEYLSEKLQKKLSKTIYSNAALNLFLVVDMDLRAVGIDSGNIWYTVSPDLDRVYHRMMAKNLLKEDCFPGIFISSPTLKDPVSFNGRHHTLELVTFIDYETFRRFEHSQFGHRPAEYLEFKDALVSKMLKTAEFVIPGLSQHIVLKELGTPLSSNHYVETTRGNSYGTEKSRKQIGPFAYQAKSEIEGLFLCGASTLAHGVTGAAVSGITAAAVVLGCEQDHLLQYNESQALRIYDAEDSSSWPTWVNDKINVRRRSGTYE